MEIAASFVAGMLVVAIIVYVFAQRQMDEVGKRFALSEPSCPWREDVLREMVAHWHTDALDSVVHELKSEEASEINNGGRDAQIEFLAGVGWKPS